MKMIWGHVKNIVRAISILLMIIIKWVPRYLVIWTIYMVTYERKEKLGVISKRKYRRIKQAIRYKIWMWKHMRWLCNFYHVDYTPFLKYDGNKKILKY